MDLIQQLSDSATEPFPRFDKYILCARVEPRTISPKQLCLVPLVDQATQYSYANCRVLPRWISQLDFHILGEKVLETYGLSTVTLSYCSHPLQKRKPHKVDRGQRPPQTHQESQGPETRLKFSSLLRHQKEALKLLNTTHQDYNGHFMVPMAIKFQFTWLQDWTTQPNSRKKTWSLTPSLTSELWPRCAGPKTFAKNATCQTWSFLDLTIPASVYCWPLGCTLKNGSWHLRVSRACTLLVGPATPKQLHLQLLAWGSRTLSDKWLHENVVCNILRCNKIHDRVAMVLALPLLWAAQEASMEGWMLAHLRTHICTAYEVICTLPVDQNPVKKCVLSSPVKKTKCTLMSSS